MEALSPLISSIEGFSYLGMTFLILLGSVGLPIPEETVLLVTGYLASLGYMRLSYAISIALVASCLGANLMYWLGRKKGKKYIVKYGKYFFITKKHLARTEQYFKNHGGKTVFLACFIIGLRFLTPILAGSLKMRWKRFLKYNIAGSLILIPLVISLGYIFGIQVEYLIRNINNIKHIIFFIILFFISAILFYNLAFGKNNGKK